MGNIRKFAKHLFDTWVRPKDEPQDKKPKGELFVTTPDGKTTITIDIISRADAAKAKRLVSLALGSDDDYETFIGRTD